MENGTIQIPPEHREKFKNRVRVILLIEETEETDISLIDELLANPLQIEDFRPLTRQEIYAD